MQALRHSKPVSNLSDGVRTVVFSMISRAQRSSVLSKLIKIRGTDSRTRISSMNVHLRSCSRRPSLINGASTFSECSRLWCFNSQPFCPHTGALHGHLSNNVDTDEAAGPISNDHRCCSLGTCSTLSPYDHSSDILDMVLAELDPIQ